MANQLTCSVFHRSNVSDMTDLDFFTDVGYHFVTLDTTNGIPGCCINPAGHDFPISIGNLAQHNVGPNIWIEADGLAKSFYATILADLGQSSRDNMLENAALLEHFTSNLTGTIDGQNGWVEAAWLATNPATQSYNKIKHITGDLTIIPSVISAQYLCRIPKLKSTGSLFLSILLADLVFLQALWKVLNWITMAWLERSDPHANFCQGCLKPLAREAEASLTDSGTTTQYSPVPGSRPRLLGKSAANAPSSPHEHFVLSP